MFWWRLAYILCFFTRLVVLKVLADCVRRESCQFVENLSRCKTSKKWRRKSGVEVNVELLVLLCFLLPNMVVCPRLHPA